ncbi:MAG: large conductance mechanosensitive channel protein MscL [Actinomycetota bacterium]|nr:large conductance mechanosensitive channel protein MscL [Actinomycetota bacterium]
MRGFIKEFKAFALKGSLVEFAVAFILALFFAAVVTSLVSDVILNFIAAAVGKPTFNSLSFSVGKGEILYGRLITAVVNFVLVAMVLFLLVRAFNRMTAPRGVVQEPPAMRECPFCKTSIPVAATRCAACTSEVEAVGV